MNLIKIAAMDSGAHENRNSPWETTVPEGWAVIPARVTIPDSFPFVDMTVEDAGVYTGTADIALPTRPYCGVILTRVE